MLWNKFDPRHAQRLIFLEGTSKKEGSCESPEEEEIKGRGLSLVGKIGGFNYHLTVKRRVKNHECSSGSVFLSLFISEDYGLAHS